MFVLIEYSILSRMLILLKNRYTATQGISPCLMLKSANLGFSYFILRYKIKLYYVLGNIPYT